MNPVVDQTPGAAARLDPESAEWLGALAGRGPQREAALARLHEMLLRTAGGVPTARAAAADHRPELDDLAYQAAARSAR